MKNIPPFELTRQYKIIGEQVSVAVAEVLNSGRYIGGPTVESFEQQFAAYISVSECVACNSGTDALYLALRALEIEPGDEVITTPFTFIATAEVITAVGATPVFVDIDAQTFNIDLTKIAAAITDKTRAIIPVHLFGQPVDMTSLMNIAQTYSLAIIEDCAQATGAAWAGQKVGSISHIGCFSFYPTKNLGACGDGGAVTTNDKNLAASMRMLRDHGKSGYYYHQTTGINSRLDALQAAILTIKLPYLDSWNAQRCRVAANYQELLEPLPGIVIPQETVGSRAVWNQYTIRLTKDQGNSSARDQVRAALQQLGIGSMIYYPLPLHWQPVYKDLGYQTGDLSMCEQVCREVLSLPMFPELTLSEQQQVVYGLKDCLS
ncbi:MAG: DegT/DnrJ/EryC1/StrS family aminotransferase [Symploca sp. SIO1C4]|uniref:DegT/DnrJ/EryC1/StrS family aminotransferase n=1 Tax=Symploca sp. SIO1C4 TaxID=2607765 RepID=A0A6B3NK78_9CYAN|nr:DegT/DnrJ/EryC1/StrS family aminotransferase [Symploca sp. SIO1C4]